MSKFSIQQIKSTRRHLPPRIVLYGPHKIGKSTFASCAPKPAFIVTEDGQDAIDGMGFPLCQSWDDVLGQIEALYSDPHDYKTVAVDSGDWAERLLHKHICAKQNVSSIEKVEKGYGKGYVIAAEHFVDMLDGLNALRTERGMAVIVICHTEIKRYDDPLADSYDRHQIKLHKQTAKLLQEWADVIGFANIETVTRDEDLGFNKERTRALATGRRVIRFTPSPAFDAGNRYGLPDTTDLTWSAFEQALNNARNHAAQ